MKICAIMTMHDLVRYMAARYDWKEYPPEEAIEAVRHDGEAALEIVLADNDAANDFVEEHGGWMAKRERMYLSEGSRESTSKVNIEGD